MLKTESRSPLKAASTPVFTPVRGRMLQRKCACGGGTPGPTGECEACREKRLQPKRGDPKSEIQDDFSVPSTVHEALRSPGQPLDTATRSFMEPRFGHDFSQVRTHSDAHAAESARVVSALAYTIGDDIVFGPRLYQPQKDIGRALLAHELTHVIQQRDGRVQSNRADSKGTMILRNESLEREADNWGDRISRNDPAPVISRSARVHAGPATSGMYAMQLQDDPKAPVTQTQTPLERAQALVQESPATVKDRAAWILKAADQSFVTFNTTKARQNLENVRDEKQVENLDPKAAGYDVPILEVEVALARKVAQRWIDAKGVGAKSSIQFGSMIRSDATDVHGQGKAIDINALDMTTSVDATVTILNDLDKTIHASYGLGFPFQGDFFDPADNIETKKDAAERSAAPSVEAKTETSKATVSKPDTNAVVAEKPEAKPVTADIVDALEKGSSHIWKGSGTMGANGKWSWEKKDKKKQVEGGAYTRLKSQTLKDTLASRRKDGFSFVIFPDNDNHLHLDAR